MPSHPAIPQTELGPQKFTRSSANAEGLHDVLCQSKCCQLVHKIKYIKNKVCNSGIPPTTLKIITIAAIR